MHENEAVGGTRFRTRFDAEAKVAREWPIHVSLHCSCQDVAQLIIERPTIMAPVLDKGLTGQETYQALLRLYTIALQQAINMQEGNFSWVSLYAKKSLLVQNILSDNIVQK